MESKSTPTGRVHVGLDVHKESIAIAVYRFLFAEQTWQTVDVGEVRNTPASIRKMVAALQEQFGADLHFVYEAGACGFALLRRLRDMGCTCDLVAPTSIPKRPGDRVKTDRRDARELAKLHALGYLDHLFVPDTHQEAIRELVRVRMDLKASLRSTRLRIGHLLLRRERHWRQKAKWTKAHRRWILDQKFEHPGDQISLHKLMEWMASLEHHLHDIERDLAREVDNWWLAPLVDSLRALRGVDRLTAIVLLAEIGDFRRFPKAGAFMAYLGLTPSEYSSGGRRRTGSITKTGNGTVRRILTESAWTYRFAARETRHLQRKAENASDYAKDRAWQAQKRLCGRYQQLIQSGKDSKTVVTAIGRELAGYIWDIACHDMPEQPAVA